MIILKRIPLLGLFFVLTLSSCFKAIPVSKDVQLGALTSHNIHADPKQYPILNKKDYAESYKQMQRVVDNILESPEIKYKDVFMYDSITIINDDKTVNAFCTPGGYIFVYTGLMKMAKNEDEMASVIGHEIAHAELRHTVKKLTRGVGRQAVIIAGLAAAGAAWGVWVAVEVGNKILGLGLGRDQESHADKNSVIYLGTSGHYSCIALADFFETLVSSGKDVKMPSMLSSHPDTKNRIKRVKKWAKDFGYPTEYKDNPQFIILQNSLPKSKEETKK